MLPTACREQRDCLLVRTHLPGREHRDVCPFPDATTDLGSRFKHQRSPAPCQKMGSSGKPDRAGTDHRDGQLLVVHGLLPVFHGVVTWIYGDVLRTVTT